VGHWRWVVVFVLALAACTSAVQPIALPPPVAVTSLAPGDVFEMEIVGEDDGPREYTVAPDGTIDVPYIEGLKVAGLEQQDIAKLVREQLVARDILRKPKVLVRIKEFNSKRVNVSGEVKNDSSLPFRPGMTLLSAISQAGGLTPLARRADVKLTRKTTDGEATVEIDYDAVARGLLKDPPLQAGDVIHVEQRVF